VYGLNDDPIPTCTSFFSSLFFCDECPGQQISDPEPQAATITGTVTDGDDAAVPGAIVTVDGPAPADHRVITADGAATFTLTDVRSAVPVHVTISAKGFADWTSRELTLTPGQFLELNDIKLVVGEVETSVNAVDPERLAIQQVKNEEKQRIFGVIPNFYTSYDETFVPLSAKLKFQLAFKASTDAVSISAAALLAAINQAADNPDYVQGAKGYGQRFGAAYADGVSDILIGWCSVTLAAPSGSPLLLPGHRYQEVSSSSCDL
jgi:hypothetical protein